MSAESMLRNCTAIVSIICTVVDEICCARVTCTFQNSRQSQSWEQNVLAPLQIRITPTVYGYSGTCQVPSARSATKVCDITSP